MKLKLILSVFLLSTSFFCQNAYMAISETAAIVPQDKYRIGFEPQILTNQGGGVNATLFADRGINDSTSGRVYIGGGAQDFTTGGSVKYIPFPDVDQQPAMGVRGGARYARSGSANILSVEFAPLISKVITTDSGTFHPYVAIPFNYIVTKEKNFVGTQMVFGHEWSIKDLEKAQIGAELGFSLNDSYSYISGGASPTPLNNSRKKDHFNVQLV